jgi:rod shape-determining protein MreB
MKPFKNNIGFDLGTGKLRVYINGKQVIESPTEYKYDGKIISNLIKCGKIADFYALEQAIRNQIKKVQKPFLGILYPPFTSLLSIPSDDNEVALKAFREVMTFCGSRITYMLNDCFIAATGLGIDTQNATATIIDCGAGKTSITTFNGFEIIKNDILDIAGQSFDQTIQAFFRNQYNLIIDSNEAERIKIEYVDLRKNRITGRPALVTGILKNEEKDTTITIRNEEISECLQAECEFLINRIMRHIECLDDHILKKTEQLGVFLIGGTIKLKGLPELISDKIGIASKSYTLDNYMRIGLEKIQSEPDKFYKYMLIHTCD